MPIEPLRVCMQPYAPSRPERYDGPSVGAGSTAWGGVAPTSEQKRLRIDTEASLKRQESAVAQAQPKQAIGKTDSVAGVSLPSGSLWSKLRPVRKQNMIQDELTYDILYNSIVELGQTLSINEHAAVDASLPTYWAQRVNGWGDWRESFCGIDAIGFAARFLTTIYSFSKRSFAHTLDPRRVYCRHPFMTVVTGAHGSGKSSIVSFLLSRVLG
jgi:hypothetical protein